MSDLALKTLSRLETEHLKPRPRWHFLLKNYVLWGVGIFSLLLGSVAVATIIFMLTDHEWEVYEYLDRTWWQHVLISLPYFWLIVLAGLTVLTFYNFKHTRYGYRYMSYLVTLGSIIISLLLGLVLYWRGLGATLDNLLSNQLPLYNKLVYTKQDVWQNPEHGLLGGYIIELIDGNNFLLRDFANNWWQVYSRDAEWSYGVKPKVGLLVKITGDNWGGRRFYAEDILPWKSYQRVKVKPLKQKSVVKSTTK